jgi:general secretion pathway protein F
MARFAHAMATMLAGGMTLVDALGVSRSVTGSRLVADTISEAQESVSRGETLAGTLQRSGRFHPMVIDMIAVGEKSGDIETMLHRAADALDEEVRFNVETMAGLLEPVMILAMAGVVLFVVLAILLPVFEMNQLVR